MDINNSFYEKLTLVKPHSNLIKLYRAFPFFYNHKKQKLISNGKVKYNNKFKFHLHCYIQCVNILLYEEHLQKSNWNSILPMFIYNFILSRNIKKHFDIFL